MQHQSPLFQEASVSTQPACEIAPTPAKKATKSTKPTVSRPRTSSLDAIYLKLISGLKKYFTEHHFKRAVVGLSGGVDSSLTLKIAVDSLGAENVTALILPELGVTQEENVTHAKILCQFLGVQFYYQPINSFLTDFALTPWKPDELAHMNTKARIRAVLLYNYANTQRALVLGTSNKSELMLGYGTKYGDLAADVEVIGDLFKTEVISLADNVGLPPEIVYKTPTAELTPGQTDEVELGAPYKDLDVVLKKLELGPEGCIQHGLSAPLVQMVFKRVEENKHKCEPAFVIKTTT